MEYASLNNKLETAVKRDPGSLSNLVRRLSAEVEGDPSSLVSQLVHELHTDDDGPSEQTGLEILLVRRLLRDDFARKIQALAGMAGESDYNPRGLAICPYLLLISTRAVQTTMLGLLQGDINALDRVRQGCDGVALVGMSFEILLSLAMVLPALIWATILSWSISPVLFGADLLAASVTVWWLIGRWVAVVLQRKYVPRGLAMHECVGALNAL